MTEIEFMEELISTAELYIKIESKRITRRVNDASVDDIVQIAKEISDLGIDRQNFKDILSFLCGETEPKYEHRAILNHLLKKLDYKIGDNPNRRGFVYRDMTTEEMEVRKTQLLRTIRKVNDALGFNKEETI